MLRQRLLYGPLMIIALVALMWLDQVVGDATTRPDGTILIPPGAILLAMGLGLSALVARELSHIFQGAGVHASARSMWGGGAVGLVAMWIGPHLGGYGAAAMATAAAATLVAGAVWQVRHRDIEGAVGGIATTMFGFVYLGLLFGFLLALRQDQTAWVILGIMVVIKSSDIGAYFVGRTIGRRHLIPWLSPKKTWEGLAGGMVACGVTAALAAALGRALLPGETFALTPVTGFFAGAGAAILGQAGDLLASMLKRDAQQKDSGSTIPGFGGVLDVVDSLLLVAPAAYWLLRTG